MSRDPEHGTILVPREGVNDDVVRVVQWLVGESTFVEQNTLVGIMETSKSTQDIDAPCAGYFFPLVPAGSDVPVGSAIAVLAPTPSRESKSSVVAAENVPGAKVITKKARELLQQHGLTEDDFPGLAVVRSSDIEKLIQERGRQQTTAAEPPAQAQSSRPDEDDPVLQDGLRRDLKELLSALRRRMKVKFDRHVPTGDILNDRWELAKSFGFGEGTSVYDDCLILGTVRVGRHCWVGPFTILDGSEGVLTIGDHVDIGSGTHIYTHNTIERALTGGRAEVFRNATTIGSCCFIGPLSIIGPGTVLGDHCFVASGSYVEGRYPAFSYIAGNPARVVGVVEIQGNRARLRRLTEG
jgi:acetyltransferase-like isoleucine patch superfamily enzyme